ncbi:transcriptional regulator containing PAS, AAA-type ATPase, and DNA-binding domains [Desulfitobacterium dichloroeliminans LMG P-21439]|uniref:Transcriptional regulator containing PAS, AAA-type ATPase, and DNA-binding domains n=1 Tax=Desulfitobacterium dichloroeliminans (strain LMG P-21439 / DCA1) TaxID=871963 RepID=L0F386_DESDL|nr:sigma 54-interacting transcriptional regulator [Desulfitobacterium dichloroeliminans]AGA68314.1 transcriptional regulator containing PAS, AAA-type ATPase, and DNA-binding domains [Desulfitobacterium dichloroeliminans LMG P-21439]
MIRIVYTMTLGHNRDIINKLICSKESKDVSVEVLQTASPQELMEYDIDNTIVIARGIYFLTLSKRFRRARVIELAVTGYDIMRGIVECKNVYQAKKIAIIISETIQVEKSFIEDTLDVQLTVFPVKEYGHVANVFDFVKRLGFDAILGGFTVFRMAKSEGVNSVAITMGYEANHLAFNEAFNVAKAIIEERKKNELFKIILESTDEAVIAYDHQGLIMAYNQAVYGILELPAQTILTGKELSSFLPQFKEAHLSKESYTTNEVITINNRVVVINKRNIIIEQKNQGAVLILQNVDTLQKAEIDVRQKLNKKGLAAKYNFDAIIGSSEVIMKTIRVAQKYAVANSNVLIIGETGTGKELFAQSIHNNSMRCNQPFVAINCAALPEQLLESELFGYVGGAFTGAAKGGKVGLFELAHKGTLFLDEIAEMPLGLQAKLLRVLQEREIRKLGDDKNIPIDVRIISATNEDLSLLVQESKFRQDLLYRIDVLSLILPPLRERKEDIKDIAKTFLADFPRGHKPISLSLEGLLVLMQYEWPGNIRELRNVCERLSVLSENKMLGAQEVKEILPIKEAPLLTLVTPLPDIRNQRQQEKQSKMTQQQLAEMLGISRTTLWRRKREQIRPYDR